MTFRLSSHEILQDLIHEFALHHDVLAEAVDADVPTLVVSVIDAPAALWDARATVGMFDDASEEVGQ